MKPGDKVWISQWGEVNRVTIIYIDQALAQCCVRAQHGMITWPTDSLFHSKEAATAHSLKERVQRLKKEYEAIQHAHSTWLETAKKVLDALKAHDQP